MFSDQQESDNTVNDQAVKNRVGTYHQRRSMPSLASSQLHETRQENKLLICASVYTELLAYPKASGSLVETFLQETGISMDFDVTEAIWRDAGIPFLDTRAAGDVPPVGNPDGCW